MSLTGRLVIFAFLLAAMAASAQHAVVTPYDRGIDVHLSEVHRCVRFDPAQPKRYALADSAADRSIHPDALGDVFRWSIILPETADTPVVSIEGAVWADIGEATTGSQVTPLTTRVGSAGLFQGLPLAILTIDPWRVHQGRLEVLRSAVIRLRFSRGTLTQHARIDELPSYLPRLANAGFAPFARVKNVDRTQQLPTPTSWLRSDAPYLKLHTRIDAPARTTGGAIVASDARFKDAPVDRLQLWHRGLQVPIMIRKAGLGDVLSDSTEIHFFGRRPVGDTTWLSQWDTTGIFYLTLGDRGSGMRLKQVSSLAAADTVTWLRMRRHVEYDTGHYHIGDGENPDFGVFNSASVEGEGFYWTALNARAYQRLTHVEVLPPIVDSLDVNVSYYTVNSTKFTPEHRFDISVNGGPADSDISDGQGWRTLSTRIPQDRISAGPAMVKLFATGVDPLRDSSSYQSEGVVDHMVFSGRVRPLLIKGALHGFAPSGTTPKLLAVTGSRTPTIIAHDQANGRVFSTSVLPQRYVVCRASSTPAELRWPTEEPERIVRRLSMMIDDSLTILDSARTYNVMLRLQSGEIIRGSTDDAQTFTQLISTLFSSASAMIVGFPYGLSDESVKSFVRMRGFPSLPEGPWLGSIPVGGASFSSIVATANGNIQLYSEHPATNGERFRHIIPLPADTSEVDLHIADEWSIQNPRIERPELQFLSSTTVQQSDILYITHRDHASQTKRLAEHRRSWNGHSSTIYDVDAIIDEYGAGSHSPHAIKSFLRDVYDRAPSPKPKYLVLVGNASWDVRLAIKGGNVGARRPDQVPTYGRPSSDYWYGLIDDDRDIQFPELIVGRIPALTAQEAKNHIDKIILHDTVRFEPWMRNFFFVGGGTEPEGLCQIYETLLTDPFGSGYNLDGLPFCIDTLTLCAYPSRPNLGYEIRQRLNQGVEWMNFIGHGATDRFDIQGWDPNELDNAGRGGFMATYACQTGAFSNPSTACKNATYLTEPRNGLVGALGGTGWAWKYTVDALHYRLHDAMRTHGLRSVGDILYYGKTILASGTSQDGANTAMQQTLLGDPLSRVRIDTITDLFVRRQDVQLQDLRGTTFITEDDSLLIMTITVRNAGIGSELPVPVSIRRTYAGDTDTLLLVLEDGVCARGIVQCTLNIRGKVGDHAIVVDVDPASTVVGDPRPNNTLQFTLGVYANSMLPVEPQAHWKIPRRSAVVRMIDPNSYDPSAVYDFVVARFPNTSTESIVIRSAPDEVQRHASIVDWNVSVDLPEEEALWLGVRRTTAMDQRLPEWSWLPTSTGSDQTITLATTEISAPRFGSLTPSLAVDDDSANIVLARRDIPVFMRSSGVPTANVLIDPVLEIIVGDVPYANNPYFRGMNVVVLGANDTIPRAIRRYDTWQSPLTPEEAGHNGYAAEFLAFMSDSVLDNDRVLVAICDEAITGFIRDTLVDSLRSVMRSFGSTAIDSLEPRASWVFYGRRGLPPGAATEVFKNFPDSMVTQQFTIPYAAPLGQITFPSIGPAESWGELRLRASGGQGQIIGHVIGTKDDGTEVVLDTLVGVGETWRPSTSASECSYVRLEAILKDDDPNDSTRPAVAGIMADYIPADEVLVDPQWVFSVPDDPLKGDTVSVRFIVRNAYRSKPASIKRGELVVRANAGIERTLDMPWQLGNVMRPDDSTMVELLVPTGRLALTNALDVTIDRQSKQRDLYRFNNITFSGLTVRDDSIAPEIQVAIDGGPAYDGMYVVREPAVTVTVLDNSRLPINDSTRLTVFVNGDRIRAANTSAYRFFSTASINELTNEPSARAGLQFTYPMESGQNNLIVRASDATGNSDTLELRVFYADATSLKGVSVAPNPVFHTASFLVDLASNKPSVPGRIEIFGLRGERVRTIATSLQLGRSVVSWDGYDDVGAIVPVGVYHARFTADDPLGPSTNILQFVVLR